MHKLYKEARLISYMTEMVSITKEEYTSLQKKAKIADDAIIQLKLSLEDMRHGRISKF